MGSKFALDMIRKFTFISELGDLIQYLKFTKFLSQISWSSTCDESRGKWLHNDSSTCSCTSWQGGIIWLVTSAIAQVNWILWSGLSLWCIVSHRKLSNTHTWLLWMYSFKSLEKVHSMFFEPLVIGTTFSGSPSIFTIFGGLSSLIKSVSKTSCPCMPLLACHPATWPFCPLVMQSSVASLFLIITGTPMQRESFLKNDL